jgi:hypothetical protein
MKDIFLWDKQALPAMRNISGLLQNNETLIVSDYTPIFEFGTGMKSKSPLNASSAEVVLNFTINRGSNYLAVVEHHWDPDKIWGHDGIKLLSNYFDEIETYQTDIFKIHLFKIKNNTGNANVR